MTDTAKRKNEGAKSNNVYTEYNMSSSQSGVSRGKVHNNYREARPSATQNSVGHAPVNQNMRQVTTVDTRRAAARVRSRELERQRAERRREEARRLAVEAQKQAAAAAKKAARQAKRTQARVFSELKKLNTIKLDEKRYTFPAAIVLTTLAFTVLIFAIVTTSVQISEITTENLALKRSYESLVADENKLRMELEVRDDLRTIENLAKNEYGMVKQDQVERYYLRTYNADKIELIEEETVEETESWLDKAIGVCKAIGGRVLSFFGK